MELPTPERVRIAQELHDGIAQDLVGIGYSLDLLMSESSLSGQARADIRTTRFAVDGLLAKVRAEILALRTVTSEPLHLQIQSLADALCSEVEMTLELEETPVQELNKSEILAITREILRNCIAHSRATHIGIKLYSVNNHICLEVIDNGIGGANVKDGHFGIPGLIERVESMGGSITIESTVGTRIAILV